MAKTSLCQHPQGSRESNRPTLPLSQLCLFPPVRCCWEAKELIDCLRLSLAL